MPTIETGLFVTMVIIGMSFMFFTLVKKLGTMAFLFRVFAFVLFMGLALFLTIGYDVASTTTTTIEALNSSDVIVSLDQTTIEIFIADTEGSVLGWIFFGLAMFNVVLFFRNMFGGDTEQEDRNREFLPNGWRSK